MENEMRIMNMYRGKAPYLVIAQDVFGVSLIIKSDDLQIARYHADQFQRQAACKSVTLCSPECVLVCDPVYLNK